MKTEYEQKTGVKNFFRTVFSGNPKKTEETEKIPKFTTSLTEETSGVKVGFSTNPKQPFITFEGLKKDYFNSFSYLLVGNFRRGEGFNLLFNWLPNLVFSPITVPVGIAAGITKAMGKTAEDTSFNFENVFTFPSRVFKHVLTLPLYAVELPIKALGYGLVRGVREVANAIGKGLGRSSEVMPADVDSSVGKGKKENPIDINFSSLTSLPQVAGNPNSRRESISSDTNSVVVKQVSNK